MRILATTIATLLWLCPSTLWTQIPVACEQVSGIVNSYEAVAEILPCTRSVRTVNASALKAGSRVVMIQMQGARITQTPDSTFGLVLALEGAGAAEYLDVERVNNDTVVFVQPWVHEYSVRGAVQLVRVQRYGDAQIVGTVYAKPWNGVTGGVIAIDADRVLVLDANIDATGAGFRGGRVSVQKDTCGTTIWAVPYASGAAGEKGEGIWGPPLAELSAARSAAANGAGGGNGANAGGGGGGNGGRGGRGGDANSWCNPYQLAGGQGGASLATHVQKQHFFMGGGGGGAHQNNQQGTNGSAGGGIVFVRAQTLLVNKGVIASRGLSVADTAAWKNGVALQPGDGAGGAGAGGTAVIDVAVVTGQLTVDVQGGNGGHQGARYQSNGPGAGGAGGVVAMTRNHATVKPLIAGGKPGVHVSPETGSSVFRSPWGATEGDTGVVIAPFQWRTYSRVALQIQGRTTFCKGDSVVISATPGFRRYQWNTGQTTPSIVVRNQGVYSVQVTDSSGCSNQSASLTVWELPSWPLVSKTLIDFGVIEIGSVSRASAWMKHSGEGSVTITDIIPPQGVRLIRPTTFPIDLARDSIEVELEITGAVDATINDSLEIVVSQPCPGKRFVPVRATINAEHAFVIAGKVVDKAGTSNVAIPISFQHDSPTPEITGASARIHVRIDSRLYVPTGVTKGAIVSTSLDAVTKMRSVVIDVSDVNITRTPSACTEILGSTLLAPFDTSAIVIDTVEWIQISRTPRITKVPGWLVVKAICHPVSRPITLLDGPVVRIRPLPVSTSLMIDVDESLAPIVSSRIYDVHGRIVKESEREQVLDVQTLAEGVYSIVVTTPAGQWVGSVVVGR
jgi:hypothetical protein